MPLFRRHRLFEPTAGGTFRVRLPPEAREWLASLAGEMEQVLDVDDADTRRLFPTAYLHEPELDAGYQILAREQLIDGRREAIATLRASIGNDHLTAEELSCWMGVVNDLRLILGTRLDISEDDHDLDLDDPQIDERLVYRALTELLAEIVDGLTGSLPDQPDDD